MSRVRVGVSACLLGQEVRYDGGHKRDRIVVEVLGSEFEFVAVCPEVEAGLGLPRPAMQLLREGDEIRAREIESGRDHTEALRDHARRRIAELRELDLCGYILKSRSPSCGQREGLFATALQEALPRLPVEEEDSLRDAQVRERFVESVRAYRTRR